MNAYPIRIPQQLGPILEGFRRERKLTQQAVGIRAGMAQNAISQLEKNPSVASLARIFKVLAALDLELMIQPRKKSGIQSDW